MAIANGTCVSFCDQPLGWFGYLTRVTPLCRCLYPFCGWKHLATSRESKAHFGLFGYAPGTIAVNVTWMKRGFNACQTHRSMYPSIFNRFWDKASYWSKIATFSFPHLCLAAPQGVTPSEFREDLDIHKTRMKMNGLLCGEESMTICSAVLIQYQRVTDRQTDRRMDGRTEVQPIAKTCFSIADARKNVLEK